MLIQHWMAQDVISVGADVSLLHCRSVMKEKKIAQLPIVSKQNHVIGLLTLDAISRFQPISGTGMEILESFDILAKTPARDCMILNPMTINVKEPLENAALLMIEKSVSTLPVVDDNNKLLGIITEWDIFKSLVSITGVNQPGIQISCEVENQPRSLANILQLLRENSIRVIAVLSKIRTDDIRLISIRCKGESDEEEDKVIAQLIEQGIVRYWVRGKETHIITE